MEAGEVSKEWKAMVLTEVWKKKKDIKFSEELRTSTGRSVESRTDNWGPIFCKLFLRCAPYAKRMDFGDLIQSFARIETYDDHSSSWYYRRVPEPLKPGVIKQLIKKVLRKLSVMAPINITELCFPTSDLISNKGVKQIGKFVVELESLTLLNTSGQLTDYHYSNLSDVVEKLARLKCLKTDIICRHDTLEALSSYCEQLILLNGSYHNPMLPLFATTDRSSLTKLVLLGCRLGRDGLSMMVEAAPNLIHLDLSECHSEFDFNFEPIVQLRKLQNLYLNCVVGAGRLLPAVIDLAKFAENETFAQNLLVLQLMQYYYTEDSEVVSFESLCSFVNLKELALVGQVRYVDNDLVLHITQACPKLEVLDLRHCVQIGNEALGHIGRNCLHLRLLDVSECHGITVFDDIRYGTDEELSDEGVYNFLAERATAQFDLAQGEQVNKTVIIQAESDYYISHSTGDEDEDVWPPWLTLSKYRYKETYTEKELKLENRYGELESSLDSDSNYGHGYYDPPDDTDIEPDSE